MKCSISVLPIFKPMDILERIRRIEQIDKSIRSNAAGKPTALVKELKLSNSQFFEVIKLMKKLGAPIKYSRTTQSYVYTSRKKFFCGFMDE